MQEKALYRSQVENDALGILYFLITQFGVNLAIKCGLVHRWLAGYPFGGYAVPKVLGSTAAQRFVIQKFVNRLVLREQPDSVMSDIIICVLNDEQGHQQMIQVGLVPESTVSEFYSLVSTYGPDSASQHANEDDDSNTHRRLFGRLDQLWHEVNGHRMDHDAHTVPMMRRGQRVREESIEEQTLRRRRREVMVLGEPGQPIARDHIVESIQ